MSRETSRGKATVRQMCKAFGLSRQAYYDALNPRVVELRPRKERHGPWATAAELEAGIRAIIDDHPGWGVLKVWAALRRPDRNIVASRKRVWAMMRRLGLVFAAPWERQEGPVRRGHVTVPDSNRRWASDLTTVWTDQEGIVGVTVVIDCGDRTMLDIEVAKSQESSAVLHPIVRALRAEFGTPGRVPDALELRTDHGSVYTGGDCFELTQTWGLKHWPCTPKVDISVMLPRQRQKGQAFRNPPTSGIRLKNAFVSGCKTLRCTRTDRAGPLPGRLSDSGRPVHA